MSFDRMLKQKQIEVTGKAATVVALHLLKQREYQEQWPNVTDADKEELENVLYNFFQALSTETRNYMFHLLGPENVQKFIIIAAGPMQRDLEYLTRNAKNIEKQISDAINSAFKGKQK